MRNILKFFRKNLFPIIFLIPFSAISYADIFLVCEETEWEFSYVSAGLRFMQLDELNEIAYWFPVNIPYQPAASMPDWNDIVENGWGLNPNKRYRANFNVDTIYVRPIGMTNTYFFEINRTSGDIVIKETNRPLREGTQSGTCTPHEKDDFLGLFKEQQEKFNQFKGMFLEQRAF